MPCWPASSQVGLVVGSPPTRPPPCSRVSGPAPRWRGLAKPQAHDLVADVRRLDVKLAASKRTIVEAVDQVPHYARQALGRGASGNRDHPGPHRRPGRRRADDYASYNARRTHRSIERPEKAPSSQPPGQPTAQPRHAHHRLLPALPRRSGTRLLRAQDRRGQVPEGSGAVAQASDL